ncbi:hypothetical protein PHJA_000140900 [Phtheirospermum japonicum]|uniref:Uncharacterized protein n=1 Tax=Phtheirospermum japonicum TaxID=374723 RepID=A0A830B759_9LAMI|nr:hypothetical protein PHJA_000140900 [Phtheirospermum japonicum]
MLINPSSSIDLHTLPGTMFHNSYLKRLSLWRCAVAPREAIEWPSLTELRINHVELQQHVGSKNLYELWVSDPEGGVDEPLLQISAPYLHTLSVFLYAKGRKLCLENTSSLVRATIDFAGSDWDIEAEEVMNTAKELLENIKHVKVVELGSGYSEVLHWMASNGYRFPQSARTYPEDDLDCELLHLKTITIKDFVDPNLVGEPMLTLAWILLKKTPTLENGSSYGRDCHIFIRTFCRRALQVSVQDSANATELSKIFYKSSNPSQLMFICRHCS